MPPYPFASILAHPGGPIFHQYDDFRDFRASMTPTTESGDPRQRAADRMEAAKAAYTQACIAALCRDPDAQHMVTCALREINAAQTQLRLVEAA